jgi:hypothetical protein
LAVWLFGALALWRFGALALWRFGALALWHFGTLAKAPKYTNGFWRFGTKTSITSEPLELQKTQTYEVKAVDMALLLQPNSWR